MNGAASARVLVVEDEANIRAGLSDVLKKDGYGVKEVGSGEEALSVLQITRFDIAVVDIRMPGMSGIELLKSIRARWPHMAVIMLTGYGTLETAISAVRARAHDYLLKPARSEAISKAVAEALAKTRRRETEMSLLESIRVGLQNLDVLSGPNPGTPLVAGAHRKIEMGDLLIDLGGHEVHRDGEPVHLTPSEFNLLVTLATRVGEAIDYTALVQQTLGYEAEPWEARELIKRHVFALRQKIEDDPASPHYIQNVRGVGYRMLGSYSKVRE